MLDTNVWRYIADNGGDRAVQAIRRQAKISGVSLVACPAVAYEILRTSDSALRGRLAKVVTLGAWSRLMPEAYEEAAEVYRLVARARSGWLEAAPQARAWYGLQADWWGGAWWLRARRTPHSEARYISLLGDATLSQARADARESRRIRAMEGVDAGSLDLSEDKDVLLAPLAGWDGEQVDVWRIEGCIRWWEVLLAGDTSTTPGDWIIPWLRRGLILTNRESWIRLWLYEAESAELPLHWLRRALDRAASVRKITDGSPVDIQIGTYLPFMRDFVTADRRFLRTVDAIRPHAPVQLARGHLVQAGAGTVTSLVDLLSFLGGTGNSGQSN